MTDFRSGKAEIGKKEIQMMRPLEYQKLRKSL
jgi:hypothetical protein